MENNLVMLLLLCRKTSSLSAFKDQIYCNVIYRGRHLDCAFRLCKPSYYFLLASMRRRQRDSCELNGMHSWTTKCSESISKLPKYFQRDKCTITPYIYWNCCDYFFFHFVQVSFKKITESFCTNIYFCPGADPYRYIQMKIRFLLYIFLFLQTLQKIK